MHDCELTLPAALYRRALLAPQRPAWRAVDAGDQDRSWGEVASAAEGLASWLQSQFGLGAEDRLVLWGPAGWDWLRLLLAAGRLGAVDVPLDARLPAEEVARIIRRVRPRLVVADAASLERLDSAALHREGEGAALLALEALPVEERWPREPRGGEPIESLSDGYRAIRQRDPRRLATILFTSGTTAEPKGVMLSGYALASNAAAKLSAAPQRDDDVRLTVLSPAHAYARTCDLGTWICGGGSLAMATGWEGLCRAAPRVRPTVMNVVPYLAEKLAGAFDRDGRLPEGLERLRMLGCGGAALAAEPYERLRRGGLEVIHGYGLTEAGPVVCSSRPGKTRPGRVGPPVEGCRLRLDAQGSILCRGPGVMLGYWEEPSASADRIRDGWLVTGDCGRIDQEGQLEVLGRSDDAIVLSTGRKIWPARVEPVLAAAVPGIRHVVLVHASGPAVVALVDLDRSALEPARLEAEALRTRFRECLLAQGILCPLAQVIVLDVPFSAQRGEITAKGTVRRQAAARRWKTGVAGAASEPASSGEAILH